jgi:hypothetical protein
VLACSGLGTTGLEGTRVLVVRGNDPKGGLSSFGTGLFGIARRACGAAPRNDPASTTIEAVLRPPLRPPSPLFVFVSVFVSVLMFALVIVLCPDWCVWRAYMLREYLLKLTNAASNRPQ